MKKYFLLFLSILALLVSPGFSAAQGADKHPLEGRVWSPRTGGFLTEEALFERMARARAVYLGEIHDNPIHHRLQARAYRALLDRGRRHALAFEMFSTDVQPALSKLLRDPEADLSKVPEVTGWDRRGWPDWSMYAPLVELAHRAGLPVLAADLPRALAGRVSRKGLGELPPDLARELALGPPDPGKRETMLDVFFESHCRALPREKLGNLFESWRARNRTMALTMARALREGSEGALLITGGGHAERATGVPSDLDALAPGVEQFALAFAEVREGETRPEAYRARPGAYDALWFTPAHPREDPCVKYKKGLERMKKGH